MNMDWIGFEFVPLVLLGIVAILISSAVVENEPNATRKRVLHRSAVWAITTVLAATFLVNWTPDVGVKLDGQKVTRTGSFFVGFPARSFWISPEKRHVVYAVRMPDGKSELALDVQYSVADTACKHISLAAAQRYYDTVGPNDNADQYLSERLRAANINALAQRTWQARRNGGNSNAVMQPVLHAVQGVVAPSRITVCKVSLTKKKGES